ncbi:MAG: CUAEP/CCAEP-tail radical SAM protein [Acidimicrobiales bacterium]
MSQVLLVSTYELGAQPLGLARPAAELAASGHDVRTVDLTVEPWPTDDVAWADVAAFSVPMHTALRLAIPAIDRLRATRPDMRIALYGLYAPAAAATGVLRVGDLAAAGEVGTALAAWLDAGGQAIEPQAAAVDIGRAGQGATPTLLPRRAGLPGLGAYARLVAAGGERLVGTVEASRGCNHRCRHCPVPVVYDGRSRAVAKDSVLADVDAVVAAGAGHVCFADPDFLNRPVHALGVARALHARHPDVTFDATIKVSHLLRHKNVVAELADLGLAFVVSAFESTSDAVLRRLAKGHTAQDASRAVAELRAHGVEIRPSFLPFTPWTRRQDLVDIVDFVAAHDLVANVDPVQYSIRLLIPPGSLVLDDDDPVLAACLGRFDAASLGFSWSAQDPLLDELQTALAARCEAAADSGEPVEATYVVVRALVFDHLGLSDPGAPEPVVTPGPAPGLRPRLTEPWFCCAEPTRQQLAGVAAAPVAFDACPSPMTRTNG